MQELIILGSGDSFGTPRVGCKCKVCTSSNVLNIRTRPGLIINTIHSTILVDTPPELKQQLLQNKIEKIDAVVYTHYHSDHTAGMMDIRQILKHSQQIPAFMSVSTCTQLAQENPQVFLGKKNYPPMLIAQILTPQTTIDKMRIRSFSQPHGKVRSTGLRICNFAYTTDISNVTNRILNLLSGVKLWVVGCLGYATYKTHLNLDKVKRAIEILQPETTILTHQSHELDYEHLSKTLPTNIISAFDGLRVDLSKYIYEEGL